TPSTGSVALDGESISALDEDGRARVRGEKVGFVFQNFQLLPSLTALENVMLPLELRGDADAQAPARAMLGKVGLGERLGHYPRQLSGGEQQRVALARAFVTRPSLLFADEPTGNLDTGTGQAIIDLLFAMNADAGTTLVLVTHDDHLAARCHRTLRLDSGRLVAGERVCAAHEDPLPRMAPAASRHQGRRHPHPVRSAGAGGGGGDLRRLRDTPRRTRAGDGCQPPALW